MKKSLLFLLIIQTLFCKAQYLSFTSFNQENGIPSDEIYDIQQDESGNLWLATDRGVSKYDGYTFTSYTIKEGLPSNIIFKILKADRRLWFVSSNKELAYLQGDTIIPFPYNQLIRQDTRMSLPMNDVYMDSLSRIYFSVNRTGIFRIDQQGNITNIDIDENRKNKDASFGFLQLATDRLFYIRLLWPPSVRYTDLRSGVLMLEDHNIRFSILKSTLSSWSYTARLTADRWLIAMEEEMFVIDHDSVVYREMLEGKVNNILVEKEKVWISTTKGVLLLNKDDLRKQKRLFTGDEITSVYRDHEGGLWFSTRFAGLKYVTNEKIKIYNQEQTGLTFDHITALAKDHKGSIYMGSNGKGINVLDTSGQVRVINIEPGYTIYKLINYDRKIYCTSGIHYLTALHEDGSIEQIAPERNPVFIDREGKAFLGGHPMLKYIDCFDDWRLLGGQMLSFLDKDRNTIEPFTIDMKEYIECNSILVLHKDSALAGGKNGLYGVSRQHGVRLLGEEQELFSKKIIDMARLKKNFVALAIEGEGLVINKGEIILQLSEKEGLISDFLTTIAVKDNIIWVGSSRGISRVEIRQINPFKYEINNFTRQDGLSSDFINDLIVDDTHVYIASDKGMTVIREEMLQRKRQPPIVRLTGIENNNERQPLKENYSFGSHQNKITIKFTGLSFNSFGNINYQYRLKGIEEEWRHTLEREVHYSALPPGSYSFELFASNRHGIWSEQPATVSFTIQPPFWKTWWFYVLEAIAATLLIYLIIHWRVNYLRKKLVIAERFEKEKAQLELKALRAQMNPHFTFNTLNSIQSFITSREPEEAERYLAKFARLIRRILDHSREPFILLSEELEILELYLELEQMRFDGKFDYEIRLEEALRKDEVYLPGMLIQPYVENAILHGLANKESKGCIMISFERSGRQLRCEITDNGIGREASAAMKKSETRLHKSVGMSVTRERLELFNRQMLDSMFVKVTDLKDEEGRPLGTKVELLIDLTTDPL